MTAQPVRVLLVEDDQGDARLLREMLADAGAAPPELVWSQRLDEALQRLSAAPFDPPAGPVAAGQPALRDLHQSARP